MIYLRLFLVFFKIGIFSFGGGYAMIPLIQSEIAGNGWLNAAEFANIIAISEMTPGPIAVNAATFVGYHAGGIVGGFFATLGVALPSLMIILLVSNLFFKHKEHPLNESIFYFIRPVIGALVLSAAFVVAKTSIIDMASLSEARNLSFPWLESINFNSLLILIITLGAMIKFNLHPILTIITSGFLGVLFFYLF